MKTTRKKSSGKRKLIAPSGIVLFIMFLFWIIGGQKSFSQGVGITDTPPITPDPSAVLELRSSLRGLLTPRLTTAQRDAVASPATGLLIYNTSTNEFNYWNAGWIAIPTGSSLNAWNLLGNTGTTPGTNFIGTTDSKDLVFKTNNIERARLFYTTGNIDSIRIGNLTTISSTIRTKKELVLREDGDVFGTSILRVLNRGTMNGAIFETISPEYLVDFIFKTSYSPATIQRNLRFEARTAYARTGVPSFHMGGSSPDYPTLSIGDTYAAFTKGVRIGLYGTTPVLIPAPSALLHLEGGTTTAGTAPLKFTAGTSLTAPEAGAVEFDGTNYFVTSGAIRYTLAKTITVLPPNFNVPNTTAGSYSDVIVNTGLTGAADGDVVVLGIPVALINAGTYYTAWVSAVNTVTVRFTNNTGGPINPPLTNALRISIIKY